jgi:Tol biopolymer transport system component
MHQLRLSCAPRAFTAILSTSLVVFALVVLAGAVAAAPAPAPNETFAVSVDAAGAFADAGTGQAISLSDDGRLVAFTSASQNLSPDAPAEPRQAYVKDLEDGALRLVSRADGAAGEPADEPRDEARVGVERPLISPDGRFVAFDTPADNLVTDLGGGGGEFPRHVYRRDLLSGETVLVDRVNGADGAPSPVESRLTGISADGRYVVFVSETEDLEDPGGSHDPGNETVYVRDLVAGTTVAAGRASDSGGFPGPLAEQGSFEGAISRDGRYVLFTSFSANLDPDANGLSQVYRRDTETGETILVSRSSATAAAPDGEASDGETFEPTFVGESDCRVVFTGFEADNLSPGPAPVLGVYLRDLCASPQTTELISLDDQGAPFEEATFAGASGDGSRILIAALPPNPRHLYLREPPGGGTTLVDRASGADGVAGDGEVAAAALAADGCRAAFTSAADNLTPQAPPSGSSNLLQVYARQLGGCEAPAPSPPPPGGGGSGGQPPATAPVELRVLGLSRARLRLWFSAPATALLRIRRRSGGGHWRLVGERTVEAAAAGPLAVALPRLRPGRYRLAIRLLLAGVQPQIRFLSVRPNRR